MQKNFRFAVVATVWLVLMGWSSQSQAQDPTQDSDIMKAMMSKIRDVENLDTFVNENKTLREENTTLKTQLASLTKSVNELTQQLAQQKEVLQRQLLQLPSFEVKSKIIGNGTAMAVLDSSGKQYRIREATELSVQAADGIWVLMRVEKISKDFIELSFPEMSRRLFLYD
jgi:uncharacterized protein YlxW (UPF0749 family)